MTEAFFVPDGEGWVATAHTRGPWDPGMQHGGPPSALLARALEATEPRPGTRLARVTVELLAPVPIGPVEITTRVVRPGRRVELVEGTLSAGGRPALLGRAWRIRTAEVALPAVAPVVPAAPLPPPEEVDVTPFDPPAGTFDYFRAIEWRFAHGDIRVPGPAAAWTRMRLPLVPGEEPSPLVRLVIVADSGNGVSAALPWTGWLFVNPDLTVAVHREPAGEWICLAARTTLGADGTGLAESVLSDRAGPAARGLQSLLVQPL